MLDSLRRGANSFIAKILFSLLVLAFAVWGIPRSFLNFQDTTLVRVGTSRISPEEYQLQLRNERNALSNQAGRAITTEEARAYGIDSRVLTRLIASSAVDQHARDLGLVLGPKAVAEEIKRDATFKGLDGKFSREMFERFLQQIGLGERGFLAEKAREDARRIVVGGLSDALVAPQAMIDLMHAWKEELRNIEHFSIDAGKVANPPEPDEAKLKESYDATKSRYMTPETRALDVMVMSVDAVKGQVSVTPDEVAAAYENDKARFEVPERRRVLQIAFKDKDAAEAARKAIQGGKSFADAARDAGAKEADTDLGLLTRKDIFDPAIASAAFALAKDAVSEVISGRVATVLLKVSDIQAGKSSTLADVEADVRGKLLKEKALAEILKLREGVEDSRSAQKPLKEIAEALKLPFHSVASIERANKAPDGKKALDFPDDAAVVAAGFDALQGVDRDAVELAEGGYAWVAVKGISLPKQKPFEEVKADVKAAVEASNRARALADFAAKLMDRANAGEPFASLAQEAGGTLATALAITRNTLPQGLTKASVTQAFALGRDKSGSSDSPDGRSRSVFKVIEIKQAPAPTKEEASRIDKDLKRQLENDIAASYVMALQARLGVKINTDMLARLSGAGAQP